MSQTVFYVVHPFLFFPAVASCWQVYFWRYYSRALAQVPIFVSTGSSGLLVTTYINRTVLRFVVNALKDIQTIKNVFFVQIYRCQRDRHVLKLNVPIYFIQV